MSMDQKRVYSRIPVSSKSSRPTMPKLAQNSDWEASNKLARDKEVQRDEFNDAIK